MEERLEVCCKQAGEAIRKATSIEELEGIRIKYLGKKGEMTRILRGLGGLDPQRRPEIGKRANEIKSEIEEKLHVRNEQFKMPWLMNDFSPSHWIFLYRVSNIVGAICILWFRFKEIWKRFS